MSESHVISGLKAKRAEIAGHIRELDKQAKAWRVRLSHIDASIKLFAPDADLTAIKPKRTRHKSYYFKHGEQTRMILDALRERPGITATEIATALLTLKGVPTDPETVGEAQEPGAIDAADFEACRAGDAGGCGGGRAAMGD